MFAPIVVTIKNFMGKKEFMKLRGKAIAKHSKVITAFCNAFDIDRTARQNLIRVARDNGKALGLLA